jgi:preprotein translocase subunit SecD
MEKRTRIKFVLCILFSLVTAWMVTPTMWSLYHPEGDAKMPSWMPQSAMKLGLDLQGGIHMVMGVDLDKVVNDQLASYGRMIEKEAEKQNLSGVKSSVHADKFEMDIATPNKETQEKIANLLTKNYGAVLSFVGEAGTTLVMRLTTEFENDVRTRALEQSIATIRNRIDEFGVAEPIITRKGDNQILVQFPGAKEPERLKNLIGQTAQLKFQIVPDCRDMQCLAKQQADLAEKIKAAETKGSYTRDSFKRLSEYRARINQDLKDQIPPETEVSFEKARDVNVNNTNTLVPFLLSTKHVLSGEFIENAFVTLQSNDRMRIGPEQPVVSFQMNAVGAPLLASLTTDFQKYYMAIVLDGIVKSAPAINSPIPGGQGVITLGSGGMEEMNVEARDLAIVLRAGALPATIEMQEERTIGPSIGKDAIVAGKKALGITSVVVLIFMLVYYGFSGVIGCFVTIVNVGLIVAILGAMGATLTLPGIAGIVLTLGMAVDALIIIFERMREEIRAKRGRRQVIELGFDHAFATILDSNVTTAIGAIVLLQYGTGSIRGFALTLLVGIIANVFMASFFMKAIFEFILTLSERDAKPLSIGLSDKELQEVHA